MKRILVFFILGTLFFQSWTNAFALAPILPLHVIFGATSVLILLIGSTFCGLKLKTKVYKYEDIMLIFLIILIIITSLVNPRSTSINYISAYTYTFIGGFLVFKGALYKYVSTKVILRWIVIGVIVAAVGSIAEFCLTFFAKIDVNPYLFRLRASEALYGGLFPRSAAFSTEPGILAFYFETLGFVAIWDIWNWSWGCAWKIIGTVTIVLGWLLAFSAASIAAITIGGIVALLVKYVRSSKPGPRVVPFVLIPLIVVGIIAVFQFARDTLLGQILLKLSLQGEEVGSAGKRLDRWYSGFEKVADRPLFGEGPGTAAAQGRISNISWYLFLAVEAGLLSSLSVVLFMFVKLKRILSSSLREKYWIIVGYIAGGIHLAVISTFFHPFLWTLISVYDVRETRLEEGKAEDKLISKK